jgi:hypothetical protein
MNVFGPQMDEAVGSVGHCITSNFSDKGPSPQCLQTSSRVCLAFYPMDSWGSFIGAGGKVILV